MAAFKKDHPTSSSLQCVASKRKKIIHLQLHFLRCMNVRTTSHTYCAYILTKKQNQLDQAEPIARDAAAPFENGPFSIRVDGLLLLLIPLLNLVTHRLNSFLPAAAVAAPRIGIDIIDACGLWRRFLRSRRGAGGVFGR